MQKHFYVSSHGDDGELTHIILDEAGHVFSQQVYPTITSSDFLCYADNRLYVLLREPYRGQSGVQEYCIESDGSLSPSNPPIPTRGSIASYVLKYSGSLYVTNYIQGTTIRLPDRMVVHTGSSVHPIRQKCSHPHCIMPVPQSDMLAICDLGTDKIYFTDSDLNTISVTSMPSGYGPRHLAFNEEGTVAYCVNEMSSTLSVLTRCDNAFIPYGHYSTLPADYDGTSTAAAIRIHDNRLYVSNRGHDSICVFDISELSPVQIGFIPSGGESPRDFVISDNYLLCGNESGNITVFDLGRPLGSEPISSLPMKCPWCIVPISL